MANEIKLFVALYTDADVHGDLAAAIKAQGYDAISALDFDKEQAELPDELQLAYAATQDRTILTHNQKHFEPLHRQWLSDGREHAGIILSIRAPIGELLRRMLRLLNKVTADEMRNNLRYLSDFS